MSLGFPLFDLVFSYLSIRTYLLLIIFDPIYPYIFLHYAWASLGFMDGLHVLSAEPQCRDFLKGFSTSPKWRRSVNSH